MELLGLRDGKNHIPMVDHPNFTSAPATSRAPRLVTRRRVLEVRVAATGAMPKLAGSTSVKFNASVQDKGPEFAGKTTCRHQSRILKRTKAGQPDNNNMYDPVLAKILRIAILNEHPNGRRGGGGCSKELIFGINPNQCPQRLNK